MEILEVVNKRWLLYLAIPASWATFFSFFNAQPIRSARNLGILGAYVVGIVMLFRLPWRSSITTWAVYAIAAGILYFTFEVVSFARAKEKDERPKLVTILHGFVAWPIMLPEVIEYTLAELGVFGSSRPPGAEAPAVEGEASGT